ncbi:O-acyltransferase WSD1 [Heracleum sosnowskyi]|uniref:O-acyltransferase WSD1 n=1 Tax=Heracleum sosnowskyi TaxID=360622 RepID=A0AAD8NEU9_9APIA|nr:O-acyltransferase WSD1 [Heracleum sosnowskyi]
MDHQKINIGGLWSDDEVPVSPTGQYFNSSVLSISVLSVLESEIPIDDSPTLALLKDLFLPINPRFSSIMVEDKNGVKQWKKVDVKLQDHVNVPTFPQGKSPEFYDACLNDYLSKIALELFPQGRPLWSIHIFKYPTSNAAGSLVFKLHHALGDGFSLMGALLSCLKRCDDPALPLTFPNFQMKADLDDEKRSVYKCLTDTFSSVVNSASDFGWSLLKSSFLQDDRTPIRSGVEGVEFLPMNLITMSLSLDQIKEIKVNLGVTINDVLTGVIFLGTRLYMDATSQESKNGVSTALVLLNTRNIGGYTSVAEMIDASAAEKQWGNQFGFLHVSVPELNEKECPNPNQFVYKAQKIIKQKRESAGVFLTGRLLETVRKYRGPEATAQYIRSTLKNSSMTVSNMIGPLERMSLANHPIKGFYFMVVGVPQSLTITMVSYMNVVRIAVGMEKGLMDPQKYKSSVESAFHMIYKAAVKS